MTDAQEITNEARAVASKLAATVNVRQRIFMPESELVVLLMDAYAQGVKGGIDRSVAKFVPTSMEMYRKLTG